MAETEKRIAETRKILAAKNLDAALIYFDELNVANGLHLTVPAQRVICIRTDLPFCEEQYQIQPGQYSLELESDIEICAAFGRLDRRHNLGYYVTGYCAN